MISRLNLCILSRQYHGESRSTMLILYVLKSHFYVLVLESLGKKLQAIENIYLAFLTYLIKNIGGNTQ
jgi:hypothetical protein